MQLSHKFTVKSPAALAAGELVRTASGWGVVTAVGSGPLQVQQLRPGASPLPQSDPCVSAGSDWYLDIDPRSLGASITGPKPGTIVLDERGPLLIVGEDGNGRDLETGEPRQPAGSVFPVNAYRIWCSIDDRSDAKAFPVLVVGQNPRS